MNVDPAVLEALKAASWVALIETPDPTRPWSLICKRAPEIAEAHGRRVQAIVDSDFDAKNSVRIMSNGTYTLDDMVDQEGTNFHLRLVEFCRTWLAKHYG